MTRSNLCVLLLLVFFCGFVQSKQRLVILMIDGMRWDYIDRDSSLKGFPRIAKKGVRVPYVTPIFPSVSFPNWYTITTGLYGESHGMIANTVYDQVLNETLHLPPHPSSAQEHWWNKTEPLWVNAEKHGVNTAMHWWDGCRVSIRGIKPHLCDPYRIFGLWPNAFEDTRKKMLGILDWFRQNKANRLAMIYYEGPDAAGHGYGPDSKELRQKVRDIDNILDSFQDRLKKSGLKDEVNLVVVSDHGMTDIRNFELIRLYDFDVSDKIEQFLGGGPYSFVLPKPGKEKKLYEKLKKRKAKGLHVYLREEIPEIYHLKNTYLTLPILLVADLGYSIGSPTSTVSIVSALSRGSHGYDPYVENSPMRTIMYARGPAFKKGVVGQPLEQTDHYNVFCHILGIPPHPNNGSFFRVQGLLRSSIISSGQGLPQSLNFFIVFGLAVLCFKNSCFF